MVSSGSYTGGWIYLQIYQRVSSTATSSGSFVEFYLPPNVQVEPSFDPNNDCRISWSTNACDITFDQTATYLKITIKASTSYAATTPNPFDYNVNRYIQLKNIYFPKASTKRQIYSIYITLYKSNVVNPTVYRYSQFVSV